MKNLLFILPDQLRADFVGCYGADFAKTPNIDKLAAEGVRYDRCISPSPLCVPARASMLTGGNGLVTGVLDNGKWLRPDHERCGMRTWPALLSERGYETVAIGKMHFYPWDAMEGFDKRIISEDKRHVTVQDDYAIALGQVGLAKYHGKDITGYQETKGAICSPMPEEFQVDQWVANRACDYIKQTDGEKPFALMVGFGSPHCPYDPIRMDEEQFEDATVPQARAETPESAPFYEMMRASCLNAWCGIDYNGFNDAQKESIRRHYSALIHRIDRCVGDLVAALKEKGIYENTTIIFSSDHGDFVGDYNMVGKHLFFEPAIHVPLIVRDADITGGVTDANAVSLTDVRATLLRIGGFSQDEAQTNDSRVLPCFATAQPEAERFVFGATDIGTMVTGKEWKLCRYKNGQVHLFDIINDPDERENHADDPAYAQIQAKLDRVMQDYVISSVVSGNAEKNVDTSGDDYNYRYWHRPYPVV